MNQHPDNKIPSYETAVGRPHYQLHDTQPFTMHQIADANGINPDLLPQAQAANPEISKMLAAQRIVMKCRSNPGFVSFLRMSMAGPVDQMTHTELAGLEAKYEDYVFTSVEDSLFDRELAGLEASVWETHRQKQEQIRLEKLALQKIAEAQERIIQAQRAREEEEAYAENEYRNDRDEAYAEQVRRLEAERLALQEAKKNMAVAALKEMLTKLRDEEVLPNDHALMGLDDEGLYEFLTARSGTSSEKTHDMGNLVGRYLQIVPDFSTGSTSVVIPKQEKPSPKPTKRVILKVRMGDSEASNVVSDTDQRTA